MKNRASRDMSAMLHQESHHGSPNASFGKAAALIAAALLMLGTHAVPAQAPVSGSDKSTTPTEELTDSDWQKMSRQDRRERWRQSLLSAYLQKGEKASLENVQRYADKFGQTIVYDPRYYKYNVTVSAVPDTTGSIILNGEVYPSNYAHGVEDTLKLLGFNVDANNIVVLPALDPGVAPYVVSTTNAATLRKEPRRRAEQVNSIARGGWARVLRAGRDNDVTSQRPAMRHHAPGAENLAEDKPEDWLLVQSMEGYIGFTRKSDVEMRAEYQVPDGVVLAQTTVADAATTIPAGAFVYGDPDNGWKLLSGEKIAAESRVSDLRPAYTEEQILDLMKPFMKTPYVWGGVTEEGIDCSGFSQFFMRSAGVFIPRDAVQQANSGLLVAWGKDVLTKAQPGDLIFFARENGRISHVAISLGGSRIIHSAGKGVHIADLKEAKDSSEEAYAEGVLFARRMYGR